MATAKTDEPAINVDHVLPVVSDMIPQWAIVRDCLDGQAAIKAKGVAYLPMPNEADLSTENKLRYASYKTRGMFVNMVGRTLNGMVGTAFSKEPIATLPAGLEVLHENVDGGAVSMDQQARQVLSDSLSVGRCGLLTDYPTTLSTVMRDKMNSGEVRPVIHFYFAEDIINWRYEVINSLRKLVLLVLHESYEIEEDEFKRNSEKQWRVLRLINGICTVQVYQASLKGIAPTGAQVVIKDYSGKAFDYIPFEFVGSRNNDGGIDEVPMAALSDINIAHYRNSCDFEEMVFILGQPTTVIAGLDETWVNEILNGKVVTGSTSALMLPTGATADYLQVNESQLALKAMEHKESMAQAIGARLVNPNTTQRTAKEAGMDDAAEQSVLLSAVYNVNAAYRRSIASAARFHGVAITEDAGYELNTDFEIMQLDQTALTARIKMWTDSAITFSEMRSMLRRAGVAELDDDEAKAELEEEAASNLAAMGMTPDQFDPNTDPAADPFGEEEEA